MNPEVKAQWVQALRSGEYKQASNYLKRPEGFCCLGVLCDLAAKAGIGEWRDGDGFKYFRVEGEEWAYLTLPVEVQKWAGLEDDNPYISNELDSDGDNVSAASANDNEGWDFSQIADAIEGFL